MWTPDFAFYFWLIEENTSDNEDFRSIVFQLFQFEPEQKKNVWQLEPLERN